MRSPSPLASSGLQIAFREPEPMPWPLPGPDPADPVFLALAKPTGAVVVTENQAHLPLQIRDGGNVMSSREYVEQSPKPMSIQCSRGGRMAPDDH